MPEQLILTNGQAPGDVLMFTAAIRDLHIAHPGEYITELQTIAQPLWDNNPFAQRVNTGQPHKRLKIGYSTSINNCNQRAGHFTTGFVRDLEEKLKRPIAPTAMRPDVYLTDEEMDPLKRQVNGKYWVVVAGGKEDFTAKIWDRKAWQATVTALAPHTTLVQVGSAKDTHPRLEGAVNLVGHTNLRQLLSLIYHAQGVICPITCTMHMAAAFNKPCVVIAGGREPWWWEAYTTETWRYSSTKPCPEGFVNQTYLHTMDLLPCCRRHGCWKNGIGEKKIGKNCRRVVQGPSRPQPACLNMITPATVAKAVLTYIEGGSPVIDTMPDYLGKPLFQEPKPTTEQEAAAQGRIMHRPRHRYGSKRRGERGRRALCN